MAYVEKSAEGNVLLLPWGEQKSKSNVLWSKSNNADQNFIQRTILKTKILKCTSFCFSYLDQKPLHHEVANEALYAKEILTKLMQNAMFREMLSDRLERSFNADSEMRSLPALNNDILPESTSTLVSYRFFQELMMIRFFVKMACFHDVSHNLLFFIQLKEWFC